MEFSNRREIISKLNSAKENPILSIDGTSETPEVLLNSKEGLLRFSGRSLPENVKEFYHPLIEWISNYRKNPVKGTRVVFQFEYFNTASSKLVWELIDEIRKLKDEDPDTVVEWHYLKDDDEMLEAGEDYASMIGIEFNYFSYD